MIPIKVNITQDDNTIIEDNRTHTDICKGDSVERSREYLDRWKKHASQPSENVHAKEATVKVG